jgi:hypothetical protein
MVMNKQDQIKFVKANGDLVIIDEILGVTITKDSDGKVTRKPLEESDYAESGQ